METAPRQAIFDEEHAQNREFVVAMFRGPFFHERTSVRTKSAPNRTGSVITRRRTQRRHPAYVRRLRCARMMSAAAFDGFTGGAAAPGAAGAAGGGGAA